MTQRGSAIWSYTLRSAGAILLHNVPATIITSDCLGLGRNTTPKRSRSYRAAPACIISTAQQARPNVIGHIDPLRDQLISASSDVVTKPFSRTPSIAIASPYAVAEGSRRRLFSDRRGNDVLRVGGLPWSPGRIPGPLLPGVQRYSHSSAPFF